MIEVSQVVLVVKNLPVNAGDTRDTGSTPGSGRSPGVGNGHPLQFSCLENPMDRGTQWATVHGGHKETDTTEATQHTYIYILTTSSNQEKAMASHSSTLAWKIPWTEEPGRLQSMGLLRVGHD